MNNWSAEVNKWIHEEIDKVCNRKWTCTIKLHILRGEVMKREFPDVKYRPKKGKGEVEIPNENSSQINTEFKKQLRKVEVSDD